ncbi:unnamed protein product [Onchocerca flexuosa]|uniref:CULLIN_2 domain-containing protein n=1 Tax=Onchocerca flexuosa TaxID=387005 RepID=A0A183HN53_9BILA|nr:unnamed protein product [Onchocerca flexuosa]
MDQFNPKFRQRPDTVRCIITYITGEKREELSEQLAMRRTAFLDEEELIGVNDELVPGTKISVEGEIKKKEKRNGTCINVKVDTIHCKVCDVYVQFWSIKNILHFSQFCKIFIQFFSTECSWMNWLPDPPDANPCQSRRYRQNADVFNMLVSVYGSKEIFVKEYRELLAERLTKSWNRDPQFEERYLELLKLRFSEGELQQCEVMLKDMRDSEHIDRLVDNLLVN